YLSTNLDFSVSPELAGLAASGVVAPSKIITTAGGKKVGIVGATTPLLPGISSPPAGIMKNWSAANTEAQNLAAMLPLVQAEIDRLRNAEGVTVVIVMSHLQGAQNEINTLVPGLRGIDMVISGGGHELMSDPDDVHILSYGAPVIAPTFNTHPVYSIDLDGKSIPVVTGHFGNRYVGEVKFTLDDATGQVVSLDDTRMIRVSGAAADADRVTPDATLNAAVVTPVLNYVSALNAQVIGTTAIKLNGPTHASCTPAPCQYTEGVRNAETGMGNLVADAMRFAGNTDVAIQNGGGIRASLGVPGNVTLGDTFNILTFTNLVKRAPAMNATQLKDILEHAVGAASATGAADVGTGDRIRRVVLDDGTVLIDNGVVVNTDRSFSFTTIDFTANGGDNYPFAANGVVFENNPFSITYQQALADLIATPKAAGGLQRVNAADGDEITVNLYGEENAFDRYGRLIDLNVSAIVAGQTFNGNAARNTIVGTAGDDILRGGIGADTLTGGAGGDRFVYVSMRDAGDTLVDFTPYADRIDLTGLLFNLGYTASQPVTDGYV
ncbi:MAG: alkaline phosphatase, partial [Hydrogenophilales bacterium 16-61-112]